MIWVLAFLVLWGLGAAATWLFVDLVESVHFPEHQWMTGTWVIAVLVFLWPVIVLVAIALLYVEPGFMDSGDPWEIDSGPI